MKYKICISGSAETEYCTPGTVEKAMQIGRLIAKRGVVLVTGATTGIPYWAAKGAKERRAKQDVIDNPIPFAQLCVLCGSAVNLQVIQKV